MGNFRLNFDPMFVTKFGSTQLASTSKIKCNDWLDGPNPQTASFQAQDIKKQVSCELWISLHSSQALVAKIKCSICSFSCDFENAGHCPALNHFLFLYGYIGFLAAGGLPPGWILRVTVALQYRNVTPARIF